MKLYEPDDQMLSLIRDNYNVLQSLGAFGIRLGFGDKNVREVCEESNVDTFTFLAVVKEECDRDAEDSYTRTHHCHPPRG